MDNQKTTTSITSLEDAHGMVHDICFHIGNNDIKTAKNLLKCLDMLLHDAIETELKTEGEVIEDVFGRLGNILKTN